MSSLSKADKKIVEKLLGMAGGYVLDFSNNTLSEFVVDSVEVDIYDDKYEFLGTSKANRLRALWSLEPDHLVGRLLLALVDYRVDQNPETAAQESDLIQKCRVIAGRLLEITPSLGGLQSHAQSLDANHLLQQIRRIEGSVQTDPALAIGTAKELVETCCKMILAESGQPCPSGADLPALTKQTLKELKLIPDSIPDTAKGADSIKRLLSNLATVCQSLAEIRNLYGTGHGKHGQSGALKPRHAKLAVGSAATLATFLFETHTELDQAKKQMNQTPTID